MKKFFKTLLVLAMVCAVVAGSFAVWKYQGGWLFQVIRQYEQHDPLALTPIENFLSSQTKTMQEWLLDERLTQSQTLILVNLDHPLPADYEAVLEEYNGAQMHPLMVQNYIAMRDAVQKKTGVRIYVSSDFRTAEKQAELLEYYGPDRAAPVGCSEHEAGLSLDVYAPEHASYDFLNSPAGRMVNSICHKYGFIIRYPKNKEDITKYEYEPWHLRYVGKKAAKVIQDNDLTLEEYFEKVKKI